jgi:hypothetical protein
MDRIAARFQWACRFGSSKDMAVDQRAGGLSMIYEVKFRRAHWTAHDVACWRSTAIANIGMRDTRDELDHIVLQLVENG